MKFADRIVRITDDSGAVVEQVRFGDLTDRQKILAIAHTLGLDAPSPPPRSNRPGTPCLFLGERRLLFDDKQEVKGIVDYANKPRPGWAGEDE